MISIHREGYKILLFTGIFLYLFLKLATTYVFDGRILTIVTSIICVGLFLFTLYFFRNPKRKITISDNQIIAPCDGRVVVIEETEEQEYFKDKRIQVSIFMSPLNVHLNRNPINGEVKYDKYHPGKYLVAFNPKSSTDNERHSVVIDNGDFAVKVTQIAGFVARRIVNYLNPGEWAKQGAELGFIKFGSRVDFGTVQ